MPSLGTVYLLGTLFAALLADRWAHPFPAPCVDWFLDTGRPVSLWRWQQLGWLVLQQAVGGHLSLAAVRAALPACQRYLCDPPRRRRQQAALARAWLAWPPPSAATPATPLWAVA